MRQTTAMLTATGLDGRLLKGPSAKTAVAAAAANTRFNCRSNSGFVATPIKPVSDQQFKHAYCAMMGKTAPSGAGSGFFGGCFEDPNTPTAR